MCIAIHRSELNRTNRIPHKVKSSICDEPSVIKCDQQIAGWKWILMFGRQSQVSGNDCIALSFQCASRASDIRGIAEMFAHTHSSHRNFAHIMFLNGNAWIKPFSHMHSLSYGLTKRQLFYSNYFCFIEPHWDSGAFIYYILQSVTERIQC